MDLNLLAGALRGMNRLGPGDVRGLAAATRVGVSVQALLPVVQAHGASTQFAQDLNRLLAQAVRGLSTVFVIEPPGAGKLRIEVDRQMIAVPSALRESILALVRSQQAAEPSAGAAKAPMPAAAQVAATHTAAAQ
ncbi:MAG TPA: hypothetical protein PLQ67_04945, partial [Burkholderiaceae bacterium]|nr:hypothetical protein [Burkholderiaceae bacterium]